MSTLLKKMARLILAILIGFIAVSPLVAIALKQSADKWKGLLLLAAYYLVYWCLLALPNWFPELRVIVGTPWNWSGKIYAIAGSVLFYSMFRKKFVNHDYFTVKQHDNAIKPKAIAVIFLLALGLSFFSIKNSAERLHELLFQFTLPGLDEELAFRGIILGLLSNLLKPKAYFRSMYLGNPALLISSILFGLGHSFGIDSNWNFYQNWFEFVNTFAIGLLLGWMTIRSGSILLAILSHNLINTLPKIIFWI